MPPSFQQQLSAHASLLTSSHPHPLFQLTPCLFSPYPHCLIKAQDLTCFQSQPFLHSLSQSHASPLPLTFLHSHSYTASRLVSASQSFTPPHSLALLQPRSFSGTPYSFSFSLQNFYSTGFRVLYTWFCCLCCLSCGYAINSKWVIVKVQRKGLITLSVCTINRLKFVVWVFLCLV